MPLSRTGRLIKPVIASFMLGGGASDEHHCNALETSPFMALSSLLSLSWGLALSQRAEQQLPEGNICSGGSGCRLRLFDRAVDLPA